MKMLHIRIDETTAKIIEENAQKQGIKFTRYARSLMEKGLVVDHQIQAGNILHTADKGSASLNEKILEIAWENLMLTRKLIRKSCGTTEEYSQILEAAMIGAKQNISKITVNR